MPVKIARYFQLILGAIPAFWILLFVVYILSANGSQMVNDTISNLTFVSLFVAFHSIWIWLLFTTVISVFSKKIIYERCSLIVFIVGSIGLILILSFDPGNHIEILLD